MVLRMKKKIEIKVVQDPRHKTMFEFFLGKNKIASAAGYDDRDYILQALEKGISIGLTQNKKSKK